MSILTFDRVSTGSAEPSPAPVARRGFWVRVFDRFVDARQRRAMEEIGRYHRHLLPRELEDVSCKIDRRSCDALPFVR